MWDIVYLHVFRCVYVSLWKLVTIERLFKEEGVMTVETDRQTDNHARVHPP